MEFAVLKKKLTSFRSKDGKLKKVPGELLVVVLRTWEAYTGPMAEFSREVGLRQSQLGPLIHRARLYAKSSVQGAEDFTEIRVAESSPVPGNGGIELTWEEGKVIRFSRTEELVDFLNRRTKIFIFKKSTDMRASYDSLFERVKHILKKNPFSGHLFVFVNERRNSCKCLHYDGTGFVLLCKRLEKGVFSRVNQLLRGEIILTQAEFSLFFEGANLEARFIDSPAAQRKFFKAPRPTRSCTRHPSVYSSGNGTAGTSGNSNSSGPQGNSA
jgi:transposase